jgi:hypothetical protein
MDCRRPFCKECLTPHGGGLACASCLARAAAPEEAPKPKAASALWGWAAALAGLLLLWASFGVGGALLARLPSETGSQLTPPELKP